LNKNKKKTLFIDMAGVLVDFPSAFVHIDKETKEQFKDNMDDIEGIFSLMTPMPKAIESFEKLSNRFDTYILSTAPWQNISAWSAKLRWVQKYLLKSAFKRLILSHNKHLCVGEYLIDDRLANGADRFTGEHIHFGQPNFENWDKVLKYLFEKEGISE